jgi:hypothetical protein
MFNWPSNDLNSSAAVQLPSPTSDFGGEIDNTLQRTKMDSGYTLQRRRFTTGMQTLQVAWDLDEAQFAIFQGLLHHYLNDGADWFNMSLPLGNGFQTVVVRFVKGQYKHRYVPVNRRKVTATLETENISVFSKAQLDAVLFP